MHGCFLLFNILDHICTTCFVFANLLENIFKVLFANSQRYINRILSSIFKIWNFLPCFKCFYFDYTKLPLNKILLLAFKRVLMNINWRYILDTNLNILTNWKHTNFKKDHTFRYQFKKFLKILTLVVVRSFCFGLNIYPPLALITKNRVFWEPSYFLPNGTNEYEWRLY
jgi:hypothetical protein